MEIILEDAIVEEKTMGKMSKEALEKRKKDFIKKMKDPNYFNVNSYQSVSPKDRKFKPYDEAEDLDRI